MKTKNIQDVVAEFIMNYQRAETDINGADIDENIIYNQCLSDIQAKLTTTLTQLVKEVEAGEREKWRNEMNALAEKYKLKERWLSDKKEKSTTESLLKISWV